MIPHSRPWITDEDKKALTSVISSGMIDQGTLVEEFERRTSNYLGVSGGVALSSGTSALLLALHTLNIQSGSQVILPTYVCRSVMEAVLTVGAEPVLCDVGDRWIMTPENIRPHLTPRTAAIIAVHIFGFSVDVESIRDFGLPIIEDACQAFGLTIGGKSAGSIGTLGILSFHAAKCLTTGEGGMLVSNNQKLLAKATAIRDGYCAPSIRVPAPLSDLQAALGISQLKRYPQFLKRRQRVKDMYELILDEHPNLQPVDMESDFLYRFPIRMPRDFLELQQYFAEREIHIRRGVDQLLHRLVGMRDICFPNSVALFRETISIPFYPALSSDECSKVCKALSEIEI